MSRIHKRRYKTTRNAFKQDLYDAWQHNHALAMLVLNTYAAWHNRRHIFRIYQQAGPGGEIGTKHPGIWKEFSSVVVGKQLTGRVDIFHALYFSERELYDKYHRRIPETYAMGDAVNVAYRVLRERREP